MSTPASKGADSPAWTRRGGDSARSWDREKESGGVFRGAARGRGRGSGSARGRQGGRGAGGRSISARGAPDVKSTPPPLPEKPGVGSAAKNSAQPKNTEIQKVPSHLNLAVDGPASRSSDSLSPNKSSRRKRNTHKRSASAALPKPLSTTLTDGLPTSPSTPLVPSKDSKYPSPHIGNASPVHDLRQDITSLVEHVRSMAMDNNRPNSPNTHIDWAGEDDDSLPDLDDWGVSSKLASDVGESLTDAATKPVCITETSSYRVPTGKVDQVNTQSAIADGIQRSTESPTESTASLSVPPPVKRERERRRERGSRRDREKRASLGLQVNGSQGTQALPSATSKMSLLERLSSPVRPDPPPANEESRLCQSTADQRIVDSKSEPTLPYHPSLPPKPTSIPKDLLLSRKVSGPSKDKQTEASAPNEKIPPVPSAGPTVSKASNESPTGASGKALVTASPAESKKETSLTDNNSTFDWSEEPLSSDAPADPLKEPVIGIEPATPLDSTPVRELSTIVRPSSALDSVAAKSDVGASSRLHMQRPLSGDVTPRQRRERSPYKTHNPRNHSAPQAGAASGLGGRHRPQHASRPIIRMDALAMISRTLREEPLPRRESPPTTEQ